MMSTSKPTSKGVRYFARVTAGTEHIAWLDIRRRLAARLIKLGWRRLEFEYDGPPEQLLTLKSVDDIYVFAGRLNNLSRARLSLQSITEQAAGLSLARAVGICRKARVIPRHPTYTVTASLVGKRNYSRYEVAAAIRDGLADSYPWTYIEQVDRTTVADIDLRVLIEENDSIAGVRLGQTPLHRRSYKTANLPGSLKPPVAYCMALLAGIRPGDRVLDPMCGAYTISIEAAQGFGVKRAYGLDISRAALTASKANAGNIQEDTAFLLGDAGRLPFRDGSIDRVISNFPWGKQVQGPRLLGETYGAALRELRRVMNEGGYAVVLADPPGLIAGYAEGLAGLHLVTARQISLFGSHPTLTILVKSAGAVDPLSPFKTVPALDRDLNELAGEFAVDNLSHPDPHIRANAVRACSRLRSPGVVQRLEELLRDEDVNVRRAASEALEQ